MSRSSCVPRPRNVPAGTSGCSIRSGQLVVALVHVGLLGEGQLRRFPVGALDEPDGRGEREQRLEVRLRSGAGRPAGTRRPSAIAARARRNSSSVGSTYFVLSMSIQTMLPRASARSTSTRQVAAAGVDAEVEAELRQLHGHLRVQLLRGDPVEQLEVVLRHLVGLGEAREVLAEVRQDGAGAVLGPAGGGTPRAPRPSSRRA